MCDVESLLRPPPRVAAKKPGWTTPLPHLAWHLKLIWPFIYWQILHLEKFLRTHFPGTPTYIYRISDFGRVMLIRHPGDALAPSRRDTAVRAPEPPASDTPSTQLTFDTINPPWTEECAPTLPWRPAHLRALVQSAVRQACAQHAAKPRRLDSS